MTLIKVTALPFVRMTILWEFDEKHPKQLSVYGTMPSATRSRPSGLVRPEPHLSKLVVGAPAFMRGEERFSAL
jgi:hypothetical protein